MIPATSTAHREPVLPSGGSAPAVGDSSLFRAAALRAFYQPVDRANVLRLPAQWIDGFTRLTRRIPLIEQTEIADCAAACLAMALAAFGADVPLRDVRARLGSGRGGTDAASILRAARAFGLRGRGVRIEPDDLRHVRAGAILHWGLNHYVVLERATRRRVTVLDPAHGRRVIEAAEVDRAFTGVALVLEPDEAFRRGGQPRALLRASLHRLHRHRRPLAHVLLYSALLQVCAVAFPLATGIVVDRVLPGNDASLLDIVAASAGLLLLLQFGVNLVRSLIVVRVQGLLDSELGIGFVDHLSRLPYDFFLRRAAGDLLARFQSNRELRETLTTRAITTLLDGSMVVAYLFALLWTNVVVGALALGIGLQHILLFVVTRRRIHEISNTSLSAQARAGSRLIDLLAGIETLKSMGAEMAAVDRWSHVFVDEVNASVQKGRLQAWTDALRHSLQLATPLAVLIVGAHLVLDGRLSLGTMLAMSALVMGVLAPLSQLVATAFDLQHLRSHVARIDDILQEPVEQQRHVVAEMPPISGAIRLERVSFRYSSTEAPVLMDVDLAIAPGQKVAIVGPSGAGKSTLAKLMIGLYRPTAGRVTFDDRDLDSLDPQALRRQIGVVCQGAHAFGGTIGSNIAIGRPEASVEAIVEAARLAQIHPDIVAMPMGYDTVLPDGGGSLSGGQRQRLALARALLRQPSVLLLDEATSELDTRSEALIMRALTAMRCTRIVVAHRLSTVMDADLIVVLDAGRIVERGRHPDLLARGGLYAELASALPGDRDRRRTERA